MVRLILCIVALTTMIFIFDRVAIAQNVTVFTGKYTYGFMYLVAPFVLPWSLVGISEFIKRKSRKKSYSG